MTIKLSIELDVDDTFNLQDTQDRHWFENQILIANGTLSIHSNEIGDTIGVITKLSINQDIV